MSENDISYVKLSPSTTIMEEPIFDPWAGTDWLLGPMPSEISQRPMSTL